MSRKRPPTAARRDANEPLIREVFEVMGCNVETLDLPCDLLVFDPVSDLIILVEVKNGRNARLTPAEHRFHGKNPAANLWVVYDEEDAMNKLASWRREFGT